MTVYIAPRKHTLKVIEVKVVEGAKVFKDDVILVVEDETGLFQDVLAAKSAQILALPEAGDVVFGNEALFEARVKNDLGLRESAMLRNIEAPTLEGNLPAGSVSLSEKKKPSGSTPLGGSSSVLRTEDKETSSKKQSKKGPGLLSLSVLSLLVTIVFGGIGLYLQYITALNVPLSASGEKNSQPSPSLTTTLPEMDYADSPNQPRGFRDAFWRLKTASPLEVFSVFDVGPAPGLYTVDGETPTDETFLFIYTKTGEPVLALRSTEFLLGRTHVLDFSDTCEFDKLNEEGSVVKKYKLSLTEIFTGKKQVYKLDCSSDLEKVHVEFQSRRRMLESGKITFIENTPYTSAADGRIIKNYYDIFEQQPLVGPDGQLCKERPINFDIARRSVSLDTEGNLEIEELPSKPGYAYAILPISVAFPGGCREAQTEAERMRIEAQYTGPDLQLDLPFFYDVTSQ